jgi:hypothetical protein
MGGVEATVAYMLSIAEIRYPLLLPNVGTEKRREKVVVLRELQRVIIYTRELSKQVTEGHVSTAFIAYSVDEGARLTPNIVENFVECLHHQHLMGSSHH